MCVWALGQKSGILYLRFFFLLIYLSSYLWDQAIRDENFNNTDPAVAYSTYSPSFCWAKWKPVIL